MKLSLNKLSSLDNFLHTIRECNDAIMVRLPDGDMIDMKTGFGQYIFTEEVFNKGRINDVELIIKGRSADTDADVLNGIFNTNRKRNFLGAY